MEMLISIIIPLYNVEPYIERCLRSVAAQTFRPLEVVLVDDSSTDRTLQKAQVVAEVLKREGMTFVFKQHEQNCGAATTRNTGIKTATGEYVYFLDGDDEITPDCIEVLATPLQQGNYDFTIADFEVRGGTVGCKPLGIEGECEDVIRAYSDNKVYSMPVNKLVNLSFLKQKNLCFKDGMPFEDELWSFQLACMARHIYGVKHQTYIYHLRADSTMGKAGKEHYIEWRFRIAPMMWEYIDGHGMSENLAANNTIETFIQSAHPIFIMGKGHEGYEYYKRVRKMNRRPRSIYWRLSLTSLTGFVKYFHYLLPLPVGFMLKVILRNLHGPSML